MSLKVYELAKDLKIDAIELVQTLKSLGFEVRNHMASLSSEDVIKIKSHFFFRGAPKTPIEESKIQQIPSADFKIVFVMGFNAKIDTLENTLAADFLCSKVSLEAKVTDSSDQVFYFVSSYRNLLTSYEKDFLAKHPFVTNIIACDPDFDEYEDVAVDFAKKYPDFKLTTYDERAFSKSAGSTYTKDQIDFIHSSVEALTSSVRAKAMSFLYNGSVSLVTKVAADVGRDQARNVGTHLGTAAGPSFDLVQNLKIYKSGFSLSEEEAAGVRIRNSFEVQTSQMIAKFKCASIFLFCVCVGLDYLTNSHSLSFTEYASIYSWHLYAYVSCLIALNLSLSIGMWVLKSALVNMSQRDVTSLAYYQKFLKHDSDNIDQFEKIRDELRLRKADFNRECLDFPETINFTCLIESKTTTTIKDFKKKAA